MFAAMSTMPEFFEQRINLFCAMAPVAHVHNAKSELLQYVASNDQVMNLLMKHDY